MSKPFCRIVITGQSGIRPYQIADYAKYYTDGLPDSYRFYKIEDEIKSFIAQKIKKRPENFQDSWLSDFLMQPVSLIHKYWEQGAKATVKKIQADGAQKFILAMHSTYFSNTSLEFFAPVRESILSSLKPEVFITLIDDIYDVHQRLRSNGQIFSPGQGGKSEPEGALYELMLILDWRAREIMITRHVANELDAKHYVLAVKHPRSLFVDLVSRKKNRCYVSHPITQIRNIFAEGNEEVAKQNIEEIHQFEKGIQSHFAAFLPTTIDEFRMRSRFINNETVVTQELLPRWDQDKYDNPTGLLFLPPENISHVDPLWNNPSSKETPKFFLSVLHDTIKKQIDSRDHILVEQSDFLVVYRPCFNGVASGGVTEEMQYFFEMGRNPERCIVYLPDEDVELLKVKDFEQFLSSEIKSGNIITTEHSQNSDLSDVHRKQLLQCYNKPRELQRFLETVLNEKQLHVKADYVPLSRTSSVKAAKYAINFVKRYHKTVNVKLSLYRKAKHLIRKKMPSSDVAKNISNIYKTKLHKGN